MKNYRLSVFLMIIITLFITGCEEESTSPDPLSNGLLITLGAKKYEATSNVSFSKNSYNVIKFTAEESNEVWNIEFEWDVNAQNGDTVFISDSFYNTIELTSTVVGNYLITSSHAKANETFIKVLNIIDGKKIEAEIEGFIYKSGSSTADSLKNGYLITTHFD
ncbi:MAG: hypothetical protein PF638_08120 [Candidatus Delongbacteria bacterium]|nr:hypothetical protein [Candidatus Delongbacteria bacterium]